MTTRYSEELTVAGTILAGHIQDFYATVVRKSPTYTELDVFNYPSLIRKVRAGYLGLITSLYFENFIAIFFFNR